MTDFDYVEAFSRNIGWLTQAEQQSLRGKRVAVGGLGGVGLTHAIIMARAGIGKFSIADLDQFELANSNRQRGASMSTLGRAKVDVAKENISDINPECDIRSFNNGVSVENLDEFLDDVDLYMDSLDLFELDIRRKVFARCYERNIPAITAAPMGMGTAFLIFLPGRMSFEEYFCLEDVGTFEEKIIKFVIGVSPSMQQRHYLIDKSSVNFFRHKVPSTCMGIEIAGGVACSNAIKLLLGRGSVVCAPQGLHFDAYRNKLTKTWRPMGNRNPLQRIMFHYVKWLLRENK